MRKAYRWCPNCGHEVIGTECKWCHSTLASDRLATKEKAQRQTLQVVKHPEQAAKELATRTKTEVGAKSAMMMVIDARQRAGQIIRGAEQVVREMGI